MNLGIFLALLALGSAFAAAAVTTRDRFWAVPAVLLVAVVGYQGLRFGVNAMRFVGSPDGLLMVVGTFGLAATIYAGMGLPRSASERLIYGRSTSARRFDLAITAARQGFIDAARTGDASFAELANWRYQLDLDPPDPQWASLGDSLEALDRDWAAGHGLHLTPDDWLPWQARQDQLMAKWRDLRDPVLERGRARAQIAQRMFYGGTVASAVLFFAGALNLTNGLWSGPPTGRAAVVPEHPRGRTVLLTPLGEFPRGQLEDLAAFYSERYELRLSVGPAVAVPATAEDEPRRQLVAEDLVQALRDAVPEASNRQRVVIGVTSEDLYIRSIPEWGWAFSYRTDGHLAVVSTARMGPERGPFGHQLVQARLRKIVTKNIGVLYFGLPQSYDPASVLYGNILSLEDLDGMGEDF